MEVTLYNQTVEKIGTVDLPDSIFSVPSNNDLVHQVVTAQTANKRQVLAHAKTRAEVRGGGKKPYRQKGTGRARHGSVRSPIWKGGGVTFGPTKHVNFKKKINKKMVRKALLVSLSEKVRSNNVIVVDDINLNLPKTKEMAVVMKAFRNKWEKMGSVLMILPSVNEDLNRATKNIQRLGLIEARNLNPLKVLSYKSLIVFKDALPKLSNSK